MTFLKIYAIFSLAGMKPVRRSWRNTAGWQHRRWGDHVLADQVSVYWNLDFNWTPLYIPLGQLTKCTLNSTLCKTCLAVNLAERNNRISWGMCVHVLNHAATLNDHTKQTVFT